MPPGSDSSICLSSVTTAFSGVFCVYATPWTVSHRTPRSLWRFRDDALAQRLQQS